MEVNEYYNDPVVRRRLLEYCGSTNPNDPSTMSAHYLVGFGPAMARGPRPYESASPEQGFEWFLNAGLDLFRSIWDADHLLAVFDIEYVNHDDPTLVYRDPSTVFALMQPVIEQGGTLFQSYGMEPLVVMTGQGYHFIFQVSKQSDAFRRLSELGSILDTLAGKYAQRRRGLPPEEGEAWDGMGRLLEWVVSGLLDGMDSSLECPLTIGDVVPGPGTRGRASINLDLSCYADPLHMRDVRVPFASHQKHRVYLHKVGEEIARSIPAQYSLPVVEDYDLDYYLSIRRDPNRVQEYAREVSCSIPNEEEPVEAMIDRYESSGVYQAHEQFNRGWQDPPERWGETYDRFSADRLPPCLGENLRVPNPRMLEPTHVHSLVRWLTERGWHPQDVAGLIRSYYERDYGWSEDWYHYDAATRASTWVRMYYTLLYTGRDEMTDFNCVSMQERGLCVEPFCGWNVGERTGQLEGRESL